MNLNKVELIGNLVRDPAVKELPSGPTLATFTLATQHSWRDQKTKKISKAVVEYHRVLAWGNLGKVAVKYLKKGDKVYVEGKLQTREWQDDQKTRHHDTQVIASNMIMLGSNKAKKSTEESDEIVVEETPAE